MNLICVGSESNPVVDAGRNHHGTAMIPITFTMIEGFLNEETMRAAFLSAVGVMNVSIVSLGLIETN